MKIGILTLGCPKNVADMENFKGILVRRGHQIDSHRLFSTTLLQ